MATRATSRGYTGQALAPEGSTLNTHSAFLSNVRLLPTVPMSTSSAGSSARRGQSARPSASSTSGSTSVNGHDTTLTTASNETPSARLVHPRVKGYRPPK